MASIDLIKNIDDLQQKYLSVLEDVCNIESPTNDKLGVDKVGEYFIRLAKTQGWDVEVFQRTPFL